MLKTFSIQTLGCKVNQYESDQLATLLRSRGLTQIPAGGDLRVINTCSVTTEAASKSRQSVRRAIKLPQFGKVEDGECDARSLTSAILPPTPHSPSSTKPRTLVTGCWATSNRSDASNLPGVDAVLTHHDDVAAEIDRLLIAWKEDQTTSEVMQAQQHSAKPIWDDGSIIKAGASRPSLALNSKPHPPSTVKKKPPQNLVGTHALPLLNQRQSGHQRAFLKVQDGCDAHCTYCIIPQLRPSLWSKPIHETVEEAKRLVDAGHQELVLTGIFLGAYGQPTALRRRQQIATAKPLADLTTALCTQVPNLRRLRFSSLEPGDLTPDLISTFRSHPQIVPHFHLPLQSGSDELLHRMNRQYTRDDFLRIIDRVNQSFDRPALTTDIIVGFPGESEKEFSHTLEVVNHAKFIHIHAFPYSSRPNTAAARWQHDFIDPKITNLRIAHLAACGLANSFHFRKQFLRETVQVLVEHPHEPTPSPSTLSFAEIERWKGRGEGPLHHGRCERYFDISFNDPLTRIGDAVNLRITHVDEFSTRGEAIR
jgi:threonylcarbamoyladenosine tRNA methylthiotransferase MtaB